MDFASSTLPSVNVELNAHGNWLATPVYDMLPYPLKAPSINSFLLIPIFNASLIAGSPVTLLPYVRRLNRSILSGILQLFRLCMIIVLQLYPLVCF